MGVGKKILILMLAVLVLLGGMGAWWNTASKAYAQSDKKELFVLTPGMNASKVAAELERRHLIRSALVFRVLVRSRQADAKLFAGEYFLSQGMSPAEIIDRLLKGPEVDAVRVTIPEGYTTAQTIEVLVEKGLGKKEDFMKAVAGYDFPFSFVQGAPKGEHRLDGFLFPDTYFIEKKSSPPEILAIFLKRFEQELTPQVTARLKEMGMSVHDWVTLSSLVEKEAVHESDRPLIASVFLNRLRINMPLQSCATIQYLLGTPKPKLYEKDLQIPSPYNTYLNPGLPPGPIANPGHASLAAVLNPGQTDYFYFVAKSDGYHVFAKTFEEHLQNQQKYQP